MTPYDILLGFGCAAALAYFLLGIRAHLLLRDAEKQILTTRSGASWYARRRSDHAYTRAFELRKDRFRYFVWFCYMAALGGYGLWH